MKPQMYNRIILLATVQVVLTARRGMVRHWWTHLYRHKFFVDDTHTDKVRMQKCCFVTSAHLMIVHVCTNAQLCHQYQATLHLHQS